MGSLGLFGLPQRGRGAEGAEIMIDDFLEVEWCDVGGGVGAFCRILLTTEGTEYTETNRLRGGEVECRMSQSE
jgi:hypothetical protein